MEPIEYLRAFRRRWKVVAGCLLVALVVGWFASPSDAPTVAGTPSKTFKATTYLLPTTSDGGTIRGGPSNLTTAATLALLGTVPRNVAEALGHEGDPDDLASQVEVVPDLDNGLLTISATAETAARAKTIADTFAEELIAFLAARTIDQVEALQEEIERLDRQIQRLEDRSQSATTDDEKATIDDEQGAAEAQRSFLQTQLAQLGYQVGTQASGFEVIEPATAHEVVEEGDGLQPPQSRSVILLIAVAAGLALGIVLTLVLERFDTKVRTKRSAEEAFGLPVLTEILTIPWRRRRRGSLVAETMPRSQQTDAFWLLTAALQLKSPGVASNGAGTNGSAAPKTILVTSPGPGEGKSTVVANLAATFAEAGRRVVVLSCAFRDPKLQEIFGVSEAPGLAEALWGHEPLGVFLQDTPLDGVRVLSTGRLPHRTAGLFVSPRMREVIDQAEAMSDVVLIDSAGVLATSDWTPLVREVDAVLVVARAGKTDAASAVRAAEILGMVQAPVLGVVLNRVAASSIHRAGRARYRDRFPKGSGEADVNGDARPVTSGIEGLSRNGGLHPEPQSHVAAGEVQPTDGDGSPSVDGGIAPLVRPSTDG